jgi:hypothetical protein
MFWKNLNNLKNFMKRFILSFNILHKAQIKLTYSKFKVLMKKLKYLKE